MAVTGINTILRVKDDTEKYAELEKQRAHRIFNDYPGRFKIVTGEDKGHLIAGSSIVLTQPRLEECSRDPLNKPTADVSSHSPTSMPGPVSTVL